LSKDTKRGDPPSAAQEAKKGEILNFMITGQPPSEYSLGQRRVGYLFHADQSERGCKISSAMASKPAGGGPTYQLDVTMLYGSVQGKTSAGAGATLTVNF
jgi:hypothetical protein